MKTKYYKCPSNISRLSGEPLKKCIRACKKGICWIYDKEKDGNTHVYIEDTRSWIQKHRFATFSLITSLLFGSYLIPKFFL